MARPAARLFPWIDITMPVGHPAGTWPGDAAFEYSWTARMEPDGVNLSRFASSPHNGTHSDAPFHVDARGGTSEDLSVDNYLGPCRVVDATTVGGNEVPEALAGPALRDGMLRVLFKTRTGPLPQAFSPDFKGLAVELARSLAKGGVRLVGTDAPSVDPWGRPGFAVHRAILGVGASLLENLDLSGASAGDYEIVSLPLKVSGLCAAPVRALLRRPPPEA